MSVSLPARPGRLIRAQGAAKEAQPKYISVDEALGAADGRVSRKGVRRLDMAQKTGTKMKPW